MKRQELILFFIVFCFVCQYTLGQTNGEVSHARGLKADRTLGPGGGCIVSLAINPKDANNIFASSDMGSCYVSIDGGVSWTQPYRFRGVADWFFGADENTVYAVTSSHTFVSRNKGITWTPLFPGTTEFNRKGSDGFIKTDWADDLYNRPYFKSLLEDPANSNIIYILTTDGKMARSTDGGTLFSYISKSNLSYNNGSTGLARFARLQIDPATNLTNRKLTMLALSGVYSFDVSSGNWTTRNTFNELTSASCSLPANTVANTGQIEIDGNTTLLYIKRVSNLINFESELVVSSDFGATWRSISTNIQNAFTPSPTGVNAIRLNNFTVVNKNVIYITADVSDIERILKTTDGGNTWKVLLTSGDSPSLISNPGWNENRYGTLVSGLNSYQGILSHTYNSMASTPANTNICLTGTLRNILVTNNGGDTWSQFNTDLANPPPTLPADAPASVNSDNGAYRFYKTRGMNQNVAYSLHADPFNPNHQFICYADIGLWETYDNGTSWRWAAQGAASIGNCYDIAFDPNKQKRVYSVWGGGNKDMKSIEWLSEFYNANNNAAGTYGGAYFSANGGYIWSRASGIPVTGIQGMSITVDPQNGYVYAAIAGYNGVGGIYRSTDGGESYTRFMNGVATSDVMPFSFEWNADASRLYATFMPIPHTTNFAVAHPELNYDSNTAGAYYLERGSNNTTWRAVTLPSGVPGVVNAVNSFKCDPVNPNVVYMVARRWGRNSNPDQYPYNGGIYVSTDAGRNWKLITATDINTTALTVSSFDSNRIYFAESSTSYNGGMIYYSDKGSDTQTTDWKPVNDYLQYTVINNVQQDPQDPNALYIASHGAGMWHLVVDKNIVTYAVDVTSVGTDATGAGDYAAGATVNIFAGTPPEGQLFKNWTTTNSNITFSDETSANTTFVMPSSDVSVTATFVFEYKAPLGKTDFCNGDVSKYSVPTLLNINEIENISWIIEPLEAGKILESSENEATFEFYPNINISTVQLKYEVQLKDGSSVISEPLIINFDRDTTPLPVPDGLTDITDATTPLTYTANNPDGDKIEWFIIPEEAGTISSYEFDGESVTVEWGQNLTGEFQIAYKLENSCNSSIPLSVTLLPAPPNAEYDDLLCSITYTAVKAPDYQNATSYKWDISPKEAGEIVGEGNEITINWDDEYSGETSIFYTVTNEADEQFESPPIDLYVNARPAKPEKEPEGLASIDLNVATTVYTAISGLYKYEWKIDPVSAGTITANTDNTATVSWTGGENHTYIGQARISYRLENNCGFSDYSSALAVTLLPAPPNAEYDDLLCSSAYTIVKAPDYQNATSYKWDISPNEAGQIVGEGNKITINWIDEYSGETSISYTVTNEADEQFVSPSLYLSFNAVPATPEKKPEGLISIDWNVATNVYTAIYGLYNYEWKIEPETAGTISLENNRATVHWTGGNDHDYVGQVLISYRLKNNCGFSDYSPALAVTLLPKPPESDDTKHCAGTVSTFVAKSYSDVSKYKWNISPSNAGTTSSETNAATITWSSSFAGTAYISYSVIDEASNEYLSQEIQITVNETLLLPPEKPTGNTSVEWNESSSSFEVAGSSYSDEHEYQWLLSPNEAGTVTPSDKSQTSVSWNHQYVGIVDVTYKVSNICGWSPESSPALSVNLKPAPPHILDDLHCSGASTAVAAPDYLNVTNYSWIILPEEAGSISSVDGAAATIDWNPAFPGGKVTIGYSFSVGTVSYFSPLVEIDVQPLPKTPSVIIGTTDVLSRETFVSYSTETGTCDYLWNIQPSEAYTAIHENSNELSVKWNAEYAGKADISYKTQNVCGQSLSSPVMTVLLHPETPESEKSSVSYCNETIINAPPYKNVSYKWNISPKEAGQIIGDGHQVIISWNDEYNGETNIFYTVTNGANESFESLSLNLTVTGLTKPPENKPAGSTSIEWNEATTVYEAVSGLYIYEWQIEPKSSGTIISNNHTATVNWSRNDELNYAGQVQISYRWKNNNEDNSCDFSDFSPVLAVTLLPAPPIIEGSAYPCSGTSTVVKAPYYQNAASYQWSIFPSNAGQIVGNGRQVTINWGNDYIGEVSIYYTVTNTANERYQSSSVNLTVAGFTSPPAHKPAGSTSIEWNEATTVYEAVSGLYVYEWQIEPESAGIIVSNNNTATVVWSRSDELNYTGQVQISYRWKNNNDVNSCGFSDFSPILAVTLLLAPPVIESNDLPCIDASSIVEAPYYQNATSYQWTISPSNAGQIVGNGRQVAINWGDDYIGEVNIYYTVTNTANDSYISSHCLFTVNKGETPDKPLIASGTDKIFQNNSTGRYKATSDGVQYEWMVTPPNIATIRNPKNRTTAISWNSDFLGEAYICYRIRNDCGWSEMSDPLVVQVYLSDEIPEIFTPNGDGINDTWDIPFMNPEAVIRIYNRAKKLLVEFKGAQLPWDGRDHNGNILESGYYLYQIELKKGSKVISGYVTILR